MTTPDPSAPLYLNGEPIYKSDSLGEGKDGRVFAVQAAAGLSIAVKHYHNPLQNVQVRKIEHMMRIRTPEMDAIAPMPIAFVRESPAADAPIAGFIMAQVMDSEEMSMLTVPESRHEKFPGVDLGFLVRTATNLAAAFHQIHQKGIVVGDINEKNVLVKQNGIVTFVDTDSMQIMEGDTLHRCLKWSNFHTPPELHGKRLKKIVRSVNHDAYGLAIIIFRLFMQAHFPFDGAKVDDVEPNAFDSDDSDDLIWLSEAAQMSVAPPPNAPPIETFGPECIRLFNRAFAESGRAGNRPTPEEWFRALVRLEKSLARCGQVSSHLYHHSRTQCPWCLLARRGTDCFPLRLNLPAIDWTAIDRLVARGQKLRAPKVLPMPERTGIVRTPSQIEAEVAKLRTSPLFELKWELKTTRATLQQGRALWQRLEEGEYHAALRTDAFDRLRREFDRAVVNISSYREGDGTAAQASNLRQQEEQRHRYLAAIPLLPDSVDGIGVALTNTLYNNGIRNAADVTPANLMGIEGIGQRRQRDLLAWRKRIEDSMPGVHIAPTAGATATAKGVPSAQEVLAIQADLERILQAMESARNVIEESAREAHQSAAALARKIALSEARILLLEEAIKSEPPPLPPPPPQRPKRSWASIWASLATDETQMIVAALLGAIVLGVITYFGIMAANRALSANAQPPSQEQAQPATAAADTPTGDTPAGDTSTGDAPAGETSTGDTPTGVAPAAADAPATATPRFDSDDLALIWQSLQADRPHASARVTFRANRRQGPGADYCVVGTSPTNAIIQLNGRNADSTWFRVDDGSWILESLVEDKPELLNLDVVAPVIVLSCDPT